MKKLGLLKGKTKDLIKKKAYMKYYMHGVGHYLGLDVHDAGRYFTDQTAKNSRPFAPGMVLTVEPGLYIPPDDKSAPPNIAASASASRTMFWSPRTATVT